MVPIGDAGIGKTRLAKEVLGRAEHDGAAVLAAVCLPLTDKLPLLPVIDALRQLNVIGDGQVLTTALNRLHGYVRIEPSRLVPQLVGAVATPILGDNADRRGRLFSAVGEVLAEVAKSRPLVLLVEDVHWADAATLDVLTYLRAVAGRYPLTIIVTCRSDEPVLDNKVLDWLAQSRRAMATEIRLPPLSRENVAQQAAQLVGDASTSGLVAEFHRRAGGNPFLTEELLAALWRRPGTNQVRSTWPGSTWPGSTWPGSTWPGST